MNMQYGPTQPESPIQGNLVPVIPISIAYELYMKKRWGDPSKYTFDEYGHIVGAERLHMDHIEIDEHGARINRVLDNNGDDTILPGNFNNIKVGGDKARGGVPLNVPHISHDKSQNPGPFHGYLEKSLATFEPSLSTGNIAVYSLSDKEISPEMNPHPGIFHLMIHKIEEDGSITTCIQTFNFGSQTVDILPAVHPYLLTLDTNFSDIRTNLPVLSEDLILETLQKTMKFSMQGNHSNLISLLLQTNRHMIIISPLAGFGRDSQYWLWSDNERFICPEATSGGRVFYNRNLPNAKDEPDNPDAQDRIQINPNEFGIFCFNINISLVEA